jgi:hypothetical protein
LSASCHSPSEVADGERPRRPDGVRALRADSRRDRRDPERARRDVIDDRTAAARIVCARQLRAEEVGKRKPAGEDEPGVAIVRVEKIAAALEGEADGGLDRLVAFGAHRDPDLSLPIELEAARVDGALQEHRAQQRAELVARELGRRGRRHREERSASEAPYLPA